MNLWTVSKLTQLPFSIRRKLRFYAPLIESLDFMGVDMDASPIGLVPVPAVSFVRASTSSAIWRDGASHFVDQHVPRFEYDAFTQLPLGLKLSPGETLTFSPANELHNADTLIWFEENTAMSTPAQTNRFNSSGSWVGSTNVHIKHVVKAGMALSVSEINQIQSTLRDSALDIYIPIEEPSAFIPAVGQFHIDLFPGQTRDGEITVFTLEFEPVIESLLIFAHAGVPEQVASSPGFMEFTLSGAQNKTVTMGLAPNMEVPFFAQYVRAA